MTTSCTLLQDDPKLRAFKALLESTPKDELPVRSWVGAYEGDTVFGPHFRICVRADGSLIIRTAWDRDAHDTVVQHDYHVTKENAAGIKENLSNFSF